MSLPEGYSRRLVGPNLFFKETGTVLDVPVTENQQTLVELWKEEARRILPELGFEQISLHHKIYNHGIRLALKAPFDITMAACDVIDFIWASACQLFESGTRKSREEARSFLMPLIKAEENLKLRTIHAMAMERGINVFYEEGLVTIGSGKGACQFQIDSMEVTEIPWEKASDIPIVLITGTNGKTTTVRLTSYICQQAGKHVGYCSTDWVMINGEIIDKGDYSGPTGNRFVLTKPDLDVAVLEVARGGLLKRGLANTHVSAAAVTNISADHLGEDGVETLEDLAEAKSIVYSTVETAGHALVNLDDSEMVGRLGRIRGEKVFITQNLAYEQLKAYLDDAAYICYVRDNSFYWLSADHEVEVARLDQVPMTVNGYARHNVENALFGIALAYELGCSLTQIGEALHGYSNSDTENLGRANVYQVQGATIIVDFAHNAAGLQAMFNMARGYQGKEVTVMFGQTGDRKFAIDEMCRIIAGEAPKEVLVKDTEVYLRGAEYGEIPQLIEQALERHGYPDDQVHYFGSEDEAVDNILGRITPGETYILCVHEKVSEVIDKIKNLGVSA